MEDLTKRRMLQLWRINETTFNLRVFGNQFVGVNSTAGVVATANTPGPSETFQLVRWNSDKSRVRIRAPNGLFLQVIKQPLGLGNCMCKDTKLPARIWPAYTMSRIASYVRSAKSHLVCYINLDSCADGDLCRPTEVRTTGESNILRVTSYW